MLSFFPRDVLDEIWDLIESVSEGFPTYSLTDNSIIYVRSSRGIFVTTKNLDLLILQKHEFYNLR